MCRRPSRSPGGHRSHRRQNDQRPSHQHPSDGITGALPAPRPSTPGLPPAEPGEQGGGRRLNIPTKRGAGASRRPAVPMSQHVVPCVVRVGGCERQEMSCGVCVLIYVCVGIPLERIPTVARRPGQINTCLDDVCPILAPPNRNTEMCAVGGVDVPALLSVEIMPVKPFIKRQNAKKSGALSPKINYY
jgi:hypothetical protein